MGLYDRFILPPLLNAAMGAAPIAYQRRKAENNSEKICELECSPGRAYTR